MHKTTDEDLSPGFQDAIEILNEIGELFKEQGAMDAAAGMEQRFDVVYPMIVLEIPDDLYKVPVLMKLCYEEGYNGQHTRM